MKSFAARLSVAALAIAGFAASSVVSFAAMNKDQFKTQIGVCCPAPMCPPSQNPNPCRDSLD